MLCFSAGKCGTHTGKLLMHTGKLVKSRTYAGEKYMDFEAKTEH
jgi:hypothetical protein